MRIYISGPITGQPDANWTAFYRAAKALASAGHEPVNPHCLDHDHGGTWQDFMRVDIRALVTCHAVALLPGGHTSRGAKLEASIAAALGMECRPLSEWCENKKQEDGR